jgi:hypothetical protein
MQSASAIVTAVKMSIAQPSRHNHQVQGVDLAGDLVLAAATV